MRVLVSGYYGYENLGDEALLAAVIGGLSKHSITVLSGNPAATTKQHQVPAVHRYTGLLSAMLRTDAVVFGGGGLLQDRTSSRSLLYYTSIIRLAKLLGKRVVLAGQSLGPLSAAGKRQVKRVLAGVPIGVRDDASFALATELGLQPTRTPDLALSLPAPAHAHAPDGPIVVVPRADEPVFTALLAQVVKAATALGIPVRAVAFQPADTAANIGVPVTWSADVNEWFETLQGASAVVSVRLHGVILATAAGIPSVALSYDPKVAGFAEFAGVPWFSETAEAAEVLSALQHVRVMSYQHAGRLASKAREGLNWLQSELVHAARASRVH